MQAAHRKHRKPVFTGNLRKVREKETKYLTGENGFIGTGKAKKQIAPKMKNAVAPRDSEISENRFSEIHYFGEPAYLLALQKAQKSTFPTFDPDFSFFGKIGSFFGEFGLFFGTFQEGSVIYAKQESERKMRKADITAF